MNGTSQYSQKDCKNHQTSLMKDEEIDTKAKNFRNTSVKGLW